MSPLSILTNLFSSLRDSAPFDTLVTLVTPIIIYESFLLYTVYKSQQRYTALAAENADLKSQLQHSLHRQQDLEDRAQNAGTEHEERAWVLQVERNILSTKQEGVEDEIVLLEEVFQGLVGMLREFEQAVRELPALESASGHFDDEDEDGGFVDITDLLGFGDMVDTSAEYETWIASEREREGGVQATRSSRKRKLSDAFPSTEAEEEEEANEQAVREIFAEFDAVMKAAEPEVEVRDGTSRKRKLSVAFPQEWFRDML